MKALWSPHTGIIDFGNVTKSYAENFKNKGGTVYTNFAVDKFATGAEGTPGNEGNLYPVTVIAKNGKACHYSAEAGQIMFCIIDT